MPPGSAGPGYTTLGMPSNLQGKGRQVDKNRYKFNVPQITWTQMAQILYLAGFRGQALQTFLGIAMRESAGGGTWIVGASNGGYSHEWSFGIFGLNMLGSYFDNLKHLVPGLTNRYQLLDPLTNARMAFAMYQRSGDRPWRAGPGGWNPNGYAGYGTDQARAAATIQAVSAANMFGKPPSSQGMNSPLWAMFNGPSGVNAADIAAGGGGGGGIGAPPGTPIGPGSPVPVPAPGSSGSDYTVYTGSPAPGTTYVPAAGVAPAPTATPAQIDAYIRQNYGYMAGFLNDPEIGPLLRQAAKEGLSKELLYGRLSSTQWWKKNSDSMRRWAALVAEDPATAQQQIDIRKAEVQDMANKLGLYLSPTDLDWVAKHSLRVGLDDRMIKDLLISQYSSQTLAKQADNKPFQKGELGSMVNQIRAEALRWGAPLSEGVINALAMEVGQDANSFAGIQAQIQAGARRKYAANQELVNGINRGIAPRDLLSAQIAEIAKMLEIDSGQIDFNQPEWASIANMNDKGKYRPMTVTEAGRFARSQPGFKNTITGRRMLANVAEMVTGLFGR